MKKFDLAVYVAPSDDDRKAGKKVEPTKLRPSDLPTASVKALHIDAAMRKARKLLTDAGLQVRNVHASPNNTISVILLKRPMPVDPRTARMNRKGA